MFYQNLKVITFISFLFFGGVNVAESKELVKTSLDTKVVPIKLVKSPLDNAEKLQKAISKELSAGWEYYSYITLEGQLSQTQMLIFKKY